MAESSRPRLGKYQLVARLASGGMAEIYLARQLAAGAFSRLVVVKRILPHLSEEPRFVQMFLEEARLASQIHHPNVVQIFDVDQHEKDYYIAMEYIDGISVGALCRRARKYNVLPPPHVTAEIVLQACDGLHAAHQLSDETGTRLGLVHRDVSPHNLMIAKTGVVKLVDFGIAKAKTTAIRTRTGDIKGKFPYMSPEQVRAEELDCRTDIFSLGAILAELLAGDRLFERNSELATLKAITEDTLPVMSELNSAVPIPLSNVVAKALARPREERFASAAEMATALRAVLDQLGSRTSAQTLSAYLEAECDELLEARSRAIRSVDQLSSGSMSTVPKVEGFDASETSQEMPVGDFDKTQPMKKPSSGDLSTLKTMPSDSKVPLDEAAKGRKPRRVGLFVGLVGLFLVAAIVAGLIVFFSNRESIPSGPPLYYAHPPTYSPENIKKGFAPLTKYLQRKIDRRVEVVVTKDYATLKDDLIKGSIHFANLSPLLFVQARNQTPDIVPLVSHTYEGARTYQGYLVTRTDSGISSAEEISGHHFCYVDRGSTSGYLLPRQFLRSKGLDPDRVFKAATFSGSHEQVMRDVVARKCDAGAVYSGAFASAADLGVASSNLRLIAVAGQTPWDVICASPKLPREVTEKLRKALTDFQVERDLGRKIVSDIFRIDGFVEPHLDDFNEIEEAARAEGLLEP